MTDAKRAQLKDKIAAGEARHRDLGRTTIVDRAGEAALEAKDKFVAFAKEHPVATIAGGLAIGILISGLFKRSPTRRLGSRAGKAAAGVAALGAEFALAYAQQAMDAANAVGREGAHKLGELGDTVGSTGRSAADRAGELTDAARDFTRDAGKRLGQALRNRIN